MNATAQIALTLYYIIGFAWLLTGLLPPFGWLKHNMTPGIAALFVMVGAAIWPLIFVKILLNLIQGKDETEL